MLLILPAANPAFGLEPNSTAPRSPEHVVWAPYAEFQWWVDPQSQKINFRRCDFRNERWLCAGPMLLRGLDQKDLPLFLNYYSERLSRLGTHRLNQFVKVFTGSIGTVTAYAGTIAALSIFKNAVPNTVASTMGSSKLVQMGVHLVGGGALLFLLYLSVDSYRHLHRQRKVFKIYRKALMSAAHQMPEFSLENDALFEEFLTTFRRALFEFTHGGPTFDDDGYMIFQ